MPENGTIFSSFHVYSIFELRYDVRLGRDEMVDMRNRWPTLTPDDFANIKIRLSV